MGDPVYPYGLPDDVCVRYNTKMIHCEGINPYVLDWSKCERVAKVLPKVGYFDICNYLIKHSSAYTKENFKAYRSLDAYKYFKNGWVTDLCAKVLGNSKVLVMGKVNHSERLNEKPLIPWVLCTSAGVVICAHCTCIAGLGEACSHIGAVLFNIEFLVRSEDMKSCTETLAQWPIPKGKVVRMKKIKDITFNKYGDVNNKENIICSNKIPSLNYNEIF